MSRTGFIKSWWNLGRKGSGLDWMCDGVCEHDGCVCVGVVWRHKNVSRDNWSLHGIKWKWKGSIIVWKMDINCYNLRVRDLTLNVIPEHNLLGLVSFFLSAMSTWVVELYIYRKERYSYSGEERAIMMNKLIKYFLLQSKYKKNITHFIYLMYLTIKLSSFTNYFFRSSFNF